MHKIVVGTIAIGAVIVGMATMAAASPATPLLGGDNTARTAEVQQVDYYWNHHRYKHRSWDKRRRRWRYY
jgi:hypothetical protein